MHEARNWRSMLLGGKAVGPEVTVNTSVLNPDGLPRILDEIMDGHVSSPGLLDQS